MRYSQNKLCNVLAFGFGIFFIYPEKLIVQLLCMLQLHATFELEFAQRLHCNAGASMKKRKMPDSNNNTRNNNMVYNKSPRCPFLFIFAFQVFSFRLRKSPFSSTLFERNTNKAQKNTI